MKIRGERECTACGTRWSYYETGSVSCPACGELRSVGVGEREEHTAAPASVDLDLGPVRESLAADRLREAAERAEEASRAYVRRRGFLRGGELEQLDETYLAATELRHVADAVGRAASTDEGEELYFLALVDGADRGERPSPEDLPASLRAVHGLAVAEAVGTYREELRLYLEDHPHPEVRAPLERLDDHGRRIEALEGDVAPADAERLLAVARDLGRYLGAREHEDGDESEGAEDALATALDRLERLG